MRLLVSWRHLFLIARKDIVLEWRSRARISATVFFAIITLLLFSFAIGPNLNSLSQNAPGFFWLAIFLSSVLSLGESMRIENENSAINCLRLLPVSAATIFLAKSLVNTCFLFILSLVLLPFMIILYDVKVTFTILPLFGVLALGTAAISAPGTLFSWLAIKARAKDILLPLLLFPIVIPNLLATVKATSLIFNNDPTDQIYTWLLLLFCFNLIYWFVCGLLFEHVIEE
ncbi:MAG: heme exporter protein CcmB [Deltaproteobacteria bacterium]|nr:heme exporter protein CcmB [Deltaproteobacteria bacterium]